jgi:hypothetical protein
LAKKSKKGSIAGVIEKAQSSDVDFALFAGLLAFIVMASFFFVYVPVAASYPVIQAALSLVAGVVAFVFTAEMVEGMLEEESFIVLPRENVVDKPENPTGFSAKKVVTIVEDPAVQAEVDFIIEEQLRALEQPGSPAVLSQYTAQLSASRDPSQPQENTAQPRVDIA